MFFDRSAVTIDPVVHAHVSEELSFEATADDRCVPVSRRPADIELSQYQTSHRCVALLMSNVRNFGDVYKKKSKREHLQIA